MKKAKTYDIIKNSLKIIGGFLWSILKLLIRLTWRKQLIIGICTYKIGKEDKWAGSGKNEWKETKGIPAKQAEFVFKNKTDGIAVYSYESLFADSIKEEQNKLTEVLIKNNQGEWNEAK